MSSPERRSTSGRVPGSPNRAGCRPVLAAPHAVVGAHRDLDRAGGGGERRGLRHDELAHAGMAAAQRRRRSSCRTRRRGRRARRGAAGASTEPTSMSSTSIAETAPMATLAEQRRDGGDRGPRTSPPVSPLAERSSNNQGVEFTDEQEITRRCGSRRGQRSHRGAHRRRASRPTRGSPTSAGRTGCGPATRPPRRPSNIEVYLRDPDVRRAAWLNRLDSPMWTAEPNSGHAAIVELQRQRQAARARHPEHRRAAPAGGHRSRAR